MIYLISGASHTGKTLLAQKLLEEKHIPYLSLDHLKMGLIRSGNTNLTVFDDDKLTGYIWPIAREMAKTAIENGQNLLTFGSVRACGKIRTNLPYVDTVRIGIKLPDTVNIYIKEFDVVYAIASPGGEWWLMTSGGKITDKIDAGTANSYTKVLGVEVESPTIGADAKAVEELIPVTQETTAEGETVSTEPVFTITGADRLKAALMILDALELNDIVGEAASVNVSSLNNLELMYGTRYQVKLGDSTNMEYKIASMKQAVAQLNEYQTGILDCSFTTWTDRPGYTPYE